MFPTAQQPRIRKIGPQGPRGAQGPPGPPQGPPEPLRAPLAPPRAPRAPLGPPRSFSQHFAAFLVVFWAKKFAVVPPESFIIPRDLIT